MASRHSNRPAKPYPEFPLFAHNNGQWCRKIAGKIHSFGPWDNPIAALEKHNREYPYRKARVPVPDSFDGLRVGELCNKFLAIKEEELQDGEISERWFDDLHRIGKLIVEHIDRERPVESLGPDDFIKLRRAIVRKHSPGIARNYILRVRSIFQYAWSEEWIKNAVRFGKKSFRSPGKDKVRKRRAELGPKVFEPGELWALLSVSNEAIRAAVLLMVNCGLRNSDICKLPVKALDLTKGWLDFPRPKTGIERRAPLWPETVSAVREYLSARPSERYAELVFVTRWGAIWNRSALSHEMGKALLKAGYDKGSPEWCAKTCQTIGEGARDIPALRRIMGHYDPSISDSYRELIGDDRLLAVSSHIRTWFLSGKPRTAKARKSKGHK